MIKKIIEFFFGPKKFKQEYVYIISYSNALYINKIYSILKHQFKNENIVFEIRDVIISGLGSLKNNPKEYKTGIIAFMNDSKIDERNVIYFAKGILTGLQTRYVSW